jgi:hypothetical protein
VRRWLRDNPHTVPLPAPIAQLLPVAPVPLPAPVARTPPVSPPSLSPPSASFPATPPCSSPSPFAAAHACTPAPTQSPSCDQRVPLSRSGQTDPPAPFHFFVPLRRITPYHWSAAFPPQNLFASLPLQNIF